MDNQKNEFAIRSRETLENQNDETSRKNKRDGLLGVSGHLGRLLVATVAIVAGCGAKVSARPDAAPPADVTPVFAPDAPTLDLDARPPAWRFETGAYAIFDVEAAARPFDGASGKLAALVAKGYVHGVVLAVSWRELEPSRGKFDPTLIVDAVRAVKTLADRVGKPVSAKVIVKSSIVPDWVFPSAVTLATVPLSPDVMVFTTTLGWRALVMREKNRLSTTLLPSEVGYVQQVKRNIVEANRQLEVVDPDAVLVPFVQFPGPVAESGGTMRLTPSNMFPRKGADKFSVVPPLGWTFEKHVRAWKEIAAFLPSQPAFAKRMWTFDLTHQIPEGDDRFGLYTHEQMDVAQALIAAHPAGAAAIRLKNESLSAQLNRPGYPLTPTTCRWVADNWSDPTNLPEQVIGSWPGHEWQLQNANATGAEQIFPRFELARVALFQDPGSNPPRILQHTDIVELHEDEVLADSQLMLDGTPVADWYRCFDRMLRKYAPATAKLDAADEAFWRAHPSASSAGCVPYATVPPTTTCAP